jgi:hypothetical protein
MNRKFFFPLSVAILALLLGVISVAVVPTAKIVSAQVPTPTAVWVERVSPDIPGYLSHPSMAYDSRRGVTVMFGGISYGAPVNPTFELVGGQWFQRIPANVPSPRYGHAMVYDSVRGETVLFGGCTNGETWVWDGTNWAQRQPATSPPARCWPGMVFDSRRGVVVLFGGLIPGLQLYNDTWEWDGTNWVEYHPMHSPQALYPQMGYDAERGVSVVFSGQDGAIDFSQAWEWDGVDWTQRTLPGGPASRRTALVYDTLRNRLVLFGGSDANGDLVNDTWEWDGNSGIWTDRTTASRPGARFMYNNMIYDTARGVFVIFGGGGTHYVFADTWEWDGTSGVWTNTILPSGPPYSEVGGLAYDGARGEAVAFGGGIGCCGKFYHGDTWTFSGSADRWVKQQPATRPSDRAAEAMAFDSRRGVVMLFGGLTSDWAGPPEGVVNDTWEWSGTDWTERHPLISPPARRDANMVYDSARGVMVLFGGRTYDPAGLPFGDTWEWDGDNWTQRFPAHSPAPRMQAQMAYDMARGVTVLFSGVCDGADSSDMWEWDGLDWSLRTPTNMPSPRDQAGMAYDETRAVIVLFGGYSRGGGIGDTWEWDGTNWTQNTASGGPPGGGAHLVYDSLRKTVIVITRDGTWEYRGPIPSNNPPSAEAGGPYSVNEGSSVVLTASGSDPDGDLLTFAWDLDGDGIFETPGQSVPFSAAGLDGPSSHTVTMQVTDSGSLSDTDQASVDVLNVAPTVNVPAVAPEPSEMGNAVTATATFHDPGVNDAPFICTVNYGDNTGDLLATVSDNTCTGPAHAYAGEGNYPVTVSVTDKDNGTGINSTTHHVTSSAPQLTALNPAAVWVGLKNSDDVGTKFDLLAEVYENGNTLIGTGQLNGVNGGSSGFNNAKLNTIPLTLTAPISWSPSSVLSIKLYVRNTCSGHTHNSGTARLWFNDTAANSHFGATIGGSTSDYFLRDGFVLNVTPGPGPKKTVDVAAGAPCSPFKPFGTWSTTP